MFLWGRSGHTELNNPEFLTGGRKFFRPFSLQAYPDRSLSYVGLRASPEVRMPWDESGDVEFGSRRTGAACHLHPIAAAALGPVECLVGSLNDFFDGSVSLA